MAVSIESSVWAESVVGDTPREWNIGLSDWLKEPATQSWARDEFKKLPPSFGTQRRRIIQQKIRTHEDRIKSLLGELHRNREEVRRHHAVLAPARLLPPEILGEVFALICEEGFAFKIGSTPDFAPLLVSKSWRQLAIDTARLWGRFNLACSSEAVSKYSEKQLQRRVDEWIRRAKGIPFCITSGTHIPVIWKALLARLPQWREWTMAPTTNRSDGLKDMHLFFQQWDQATTLRTMSLSMQFYLGGETGYGPWDLEKYKPNITLPRLESLSMGATPTLLLSSITCPSAKEVTLNRASPERIGLIPSHFPVVESLTLEGAGEDTNIEFEDGVIFHHLHTFNFSSSWRSPVNGVMFKAMPKLDNLKLGVMVTDPSRKGAFHSIKRLTIGACNCSVDEVRATFACFPNVVSLRVEDNTSGVAILKALTATAEEPEVLLPKMRRIVLERTAIERPALFAFASLRAPSPRSPHSRKDPPPATPFGKCTVTMKKCTYQYTSLPDVENADWKQIKKLRSCS